MKKPAYELVKRALDVLCSAAGLVITAPLQVGIAIAVVVKFGRPVLFRQLRPGLDGQLFEIIKFRTMLPVDPDSHQIDDADRLLPLGRVLRARSLDELPTLWNVLRGDMSLVGPRPLLPEYLSIYSPAQARRHEVQPGITGLAQVAGRNLVDWADRLALDVRYVDNRCLALDAAILWRTIRLVLSSRGVAAVGEATMPRFRGTN